VAAFIDGDHLRAGDSGGVAPAVGEREQRVLAAPHDESGDMDVAELAADHFIGLAEASEERVDRVAVVLG